jgi:uncharacterized damage-inducible protein DinB
MKLTARLLAQLRMVRDTSEKILEAFETPEQWTHQVAPDTNHALWFAGHMASGDNFFIGMIDPQRKKPLDELDSLFGTGSRPTSNPDDYPPVAEVLDAMRERRAALLELLDSLSDKQLGNPLPKGAPDFLTDVGSLFELTIGHEWLHLGQVTVVRRALGHAPLFDPTPASAKA